MIVYKIHLIIKRHLVSSPSFFGQYAVKGHLVLEGPMPLSDCEQKGVCREKDRVITS